MNPWLEIIAFLIPLVMAIVLGGCFSRGMFRPLTVVSGQEYSKSHPGSWWVEQIRVPEHVSRSAKEQARSNPFELDQERDTRDLAFHMGRLLKYMFLNGLPKPVMMHGHHGKVPVHQDSRRQQDSCPSWAHSTLYAAFCSRLNVLILMLLLVQSAALTSMMAHRLKTMKYKNSFESEPCKGINANALKSLKLLPSAKKFLCTSFRSLDMLTSTSKDWHSKDRKRHDWLNDPLGRTGRLTEYTIFSVLERVASYRPFAFDLTPNAPSTLALAAAGFMYPGTGSSVQCQGCRSVMDINSFDSPPTAAKYHRGQCSFATSSSSIRGNESVYNTEDLDTDSGSSDEDEATAIAVTTISDDRMLSECSDASNSSSGAMAKEQLNNQANEDPDRTEIVENTPAYPKITAKHDPEASPNTVNERELTEPQEQQSEQAAAAGIMNTNVTAAWECEQIIQDSAGTRQQTNEAVTRESEQRHQVPAGSRQQQNGAVTRESEQTHQVPAGSRHQQNEAVTRESEQTHQVPAGSRQQQNEAVTRESDKRQQVPAGSRQQQNEAVTRESEQTHQVPADTPPLTNLTSEITGACAFPGSSEQTDPNEAAALINLLLDPEIFNAEAQTMPQPSCPDPRETCQKNPGHYGNHPMWQLQLENIPSNVRCPEMLQLVQHLGKLVVKLTIKATSKDRPHNAEQHKRYGTGMAFVKDDSEDPAPMEPSRKWNTIKRYLPGFRKNKAFIYIKTNRHLIYDAFEAENTVVDFFYDNPNGNEIVQAKGVAITHSSILGDVTTFLKCKISDLSMVEFVKNTENEIQALVAGLPERIKGSLTKRVFVISHPHGKEKVFSYGEHALVKYALKMEKSGQELKPVIAKINSHTQIAGNSGHIRKALFYTADTCPGSSGGLVMSFRKTTLNGTEDVELDLWTHSGVDNRHSLNTSAMKELTPDDILNHGHTTINRPSIQDEQEAEADAAARQVVSGPVYTVIGPPAHPVYVPYMKRLSSYPNPFNHVHTAADLADAGFFFAGYADCVRCFQCGLGLRSWKPGDSIYEEHSRNRPDCAFLQMKMRANGIHGLEFQSGNRRNNSRSSGQDQSVPQFERGIHQNQQPNMSLAVQRSLENSEEEENETQVFKQQNGSVTNTQHDPATGLTRSNEQDPSDVPKSTVVVVLEREQKYLKQLFTCKVCFEKPVKDLFLPCGELIACLECSKLLTHCPSCNKKILATVTTYFT